MLKTRKVILEPKIRRVIARHNKISKRIAVKAGPLDGEEAEDGKRHCSEL
jgi:hypothetical protein